LGNALYRKINGEVKVMKNLVKVVMLLVALLLLLGFSAVLGVLVMIYGWGLTPVSWWWIIGGVIGTWVLALLITIVGQAVKEVN